MKANIEIEIPTGKKAEWVNGVLTLVDEQVKERSVTERIKTFEDAYNALGEAHRAVILYNYLGEEIEKKQMPADVAAYIKLRIIAAALNEGWKPQFTEDERRYYPYFPVYTQKEIDEMDEEEKQCVVRRSSGSVIDGVSHANTQVGSTGVNGFVGSRLAFKTGELAKYAGEQFIEIWADYVFKAEK